MRRSHTAALVLGLAAVVAACSGANADQESQKRSMDTTGLSKAIFAGGCFWCMEPPYDELDGVVATTSGYTGGPEKRPNYQDVSSGRTGHTEAVEVLYDPEKITYPELLEVFWRNIDPLTPDAQFCDKGSQYRTAVYYSNQQELDWILESKKKIEDAGILDGPIVTEIEPTAVFWPAEEYHQDFYTKNPAHYKRYRIGCGRDRTLERIWGPAAG